MGILLDFVGRLLTRGWQRFVWLLSSRRTLRGVKTAVFAGDATACFDKIDQALQLIERNDQVTLGLMREQFGGLLVFGKEGFRAAYWSRSGRLCVLTESYVQSPTLTPALLALTLVHEAMHARLALAGVQYTDGRRAPIEVLCAMAELAFARRLEDVALAQTAERCINDWSTGGEARWSNKTVRQDTLAYLRELGTPGWIVSIVDQLSRFLKRAA